MITTTLAQLVNADRGLVTLVRQPLPMKVSYHIAKLARLISSDVQLYHEQRKGLWKRFGVERSTTPDEKAKGFGETTLEVSKDQAEAFTAQMKELDAQPVTIAWAPIRAEWLADISITAADLLLLEPVLSDDPEPEKAP